ncbi:hypothetical protein BD626DRAFT_512619 [Schizophyllum amplum]|uniref:Uncharacterized protein n=1 Tax=Schizophyllum amplum TaxID=97359 RepID=A0A550BZV8_9AGAR|nr:hypothetical protein BD626DRAFT_512619 [Auriculariopsis ampla]
MDCLPVLALVPVCPSSSSSPSARHRPRLVAYPSPLSTLPLSTPPPPPPPSSPSSSITVVLILVYRPPAVYPPPAVLPRPHRLSPALIVFPPLVHHPIISRPSFQSLASVFLFSCSWTAWHGCVSPGLCTVRCSSNGGRELVAFASARVGVPARRISRDEVRGDEVRGDEGSGR